MTIARRLFPHMLAGSLALAYAWVVSNTRYVTTGVQFVSPLAVVLLVHLAWLAVSRDINTGFAIVTFGRSLTTTLGIAFVTILFAAYTPMPADAASDLTSAFGSFLGIVGCLAVIALVVGVAAAVIYFAARGVIHLIRLLVRWSGRPPGAGESRFYDLGFVAVALLIIGTASLEGVGAAFSFLVRDHVSTTVTVAATPARVWQEVGKATSPDFPLPVMLKSIPRPVAVIDEGAALGARRIVTFKGREGEGDLVLQVVRRTDEEIVFEAVSDTSPIAGWVRQRALSFRVEPAGTGSLLTVSLEYDRLLSPAWFFRPYIRLASYLAVDVLARDTKERAQL